jgi:predicted 3-demethylubiquinone-9 3-methyltransferase (glyoxalase superfamily)
VTTPPHPIAACLWFDHDAEDAARFYAATFPDSEIRAIHRSAADNPSTRKGDVLTVEFTVLGMPFVGLNGGPQFRFSEAVSFQVYTDDQAQTDRCWNAIVGNGGSVSQCGWCKDRYGLSWQIVPRRLLALLSASGSAGERAMQAMLTMTRLDIAAIEAAASGG